ncbi:MAG: hypothetical protein U5L45_08715 [Saprospiraceae bacterium]|nr:hypothetical protein [Saprospiraceae bacterium]
MTYILGHSNFEAQELEKLLLDIFSPILKDEIMQQGTGFLAAAHREAYDEALIKAVKSLERKAEKRFKAAEKELISTFASTLEEARAEAKAKAEARAEARAKARTEAEKMRIFNTRVTVMRSWNKGFSTATISDITDLSIDEVTSLTTSYENVKNILKEKPSINFDELMPVSGLEEIELTTLLGLLKH